MLYRFSGPDWAGTFIEKSQKPVWHWTAAGSRGRQSQLSVLWIVISILFLGESQFACDWLLFFVILQTMAGEHKHRKWVKIIENYPQIHQTFSGENSLTKLKLSNDILLRQRNVDRSGNTKHQTSSMKYQQCYLFSWDASNFLGRQFFSSKLFEKYLF